jgi:hypothetical protein
MGIRVWASCLVEGALHTRTHVPPLPCAVQVDPPESDVSAPLQMMIANIDFDQHLGRIAIGRIVNGSIKKGQSVSLCSSLAPGVVCACASGTGGGEGGGG